MTNGSPPPSSDSRLAAKMASALMRWTPIGVSGWLLLDSVLEEQWFRAGLTSLLTAVGGVWAAYFDSFAARWREIASERGREDADRLFGAAGRVGKAIRWQLSNDRTRYLKAQADACEEYTIEGYAKAGGWKLLLEEVYVDLEVSGNVLFPQGRRRPSELDIKKLARNRKTTAYKPI